MTLTRHRLPAETVVLELKMLSSSVVIGGATVVTLDGVEVRSVTLLLVVGGSVVGVFLTVKLRDWAPHSFRVKTMVRFSPAGTGGGSAVIQMKFKWLYIKLVLFRVQKSIILFFIMYLNLLAMRNCILAFFFSQHINFFLEVHKEKNKLLISFQATGPNTVLYLWNRHSGFSKYFYIYIMCFRIKFSKI